MALEFIQTDFPPSSAVRVAAIARVVRDGAGSKRRVPEITRTSRTATNLHAVPRVSRRGLGYHAAGFTVIELMTSVAVLAIIIALAVPSLTNLLLDAGLKTTAIDVYTTMGYARSEAIKRNATVDIIPTGGNWKNGWTVQVGASVLKTVGPSTTSMDNITTPGTISYSGTGRLTTPGTVTYVISVSGNPNVTPRRVIIDMSGRASIRRGTS